jgi:hypothetical protein
MKIPFDTDGNMQSYEYYGTELKDIEELTTELTLVNFERGRSAMNFIYKDVYNHTYSMFLGEFKKLTKMFNEGKLSNLGKIYGKWTFRKQGANYSITLIETMEHEDYGFR